MKTHVIRIDDQDGLISILEKISWTKSPRVLLVFPRQHDHPIRKLDLIHIQREGRKYGAQVACVTRSRELRLLCETMDIPIYASTAHAQREKWEEKVVLSGVARSTQRKNLRQVREQVIRLRGQKSLKQGWRILFFGLGALGLLSVLVVFLPSATVALSLRSDNQQMTFPVSASTSYGGVSLTGRVPAQILEVTASGTATRETSGTAIFPEGYASGMVRFTNLGENLVGIPAGTVVRTQTDPAMRFVTREDVVLTGGIGEWLDLEVVALENGPDGNVSVRGIETIEGGLGASVSVFNPQKMAGGTEQSAAVATDEDRQVVRQTLLDELREKCGELMEAAIPAGATLIEDEFRETIQTSMYLPAGDVAAEIIAVTMDLVCEARYVTNADLEALALIFLDANLSTGYLPSGPPNIVEQGGYEETTNEIRWDLTVERMIIPDIRSETIAQRVGGLREGRAREVLMQSVPIDGDIEIRIAPVWWPIMPLLPFRTQVTIGE